MNRSIKTVGILIAVLFGSWTSATVVEAYGRTIVNPANNAPLSSSVMRSELQALENEITSFFTIGSGSTATSSLIDFQGGIKISTLTGLLAGNSGTIYQVSTSSLDANITGNAATVTTNANLSGVVVSSGNTTSFGSQSPGILGNPATGNTGVLATSTLYGSASTGGFVLQWSNATNGLVLAATSSSSSGITALTGAITGSGSGSVTTSFGSTGPGVLGTSVTGTPSFTATSTLYGLSVGGKVLGWSNTLNGIGWISTSTTAASSTLLSDTNTFSGKMVGTDVANTLTGRISPTRLLPLQEGTSTPWTATTTGAYIGQVYLPFAGTVNFAYCNTDNPYTTDWQIYGAVNQFIKTASSTNNKISVGQSFSAGVLYYKAGNPSNSAATSTSCTLSITETP